MVSASACHAEDESSILFILSNASMAEGIMHRTLNPAIKVRILVGVQNIKFKGMKLKWYIAAAC